MSKLLKELLLLREADEAEPVVDDEEVDSPAEEPIEEPKEAPPKEPAKPETAEDVFKDGDVEEYVNRNLYDIRELTKGEKVHLPSGKTIHANDDEYLIRNHKNIKDVKIISGGEYENSFEQIRLNQAPDAEGFTLHRSSDILEVVQYTDDEEIGVAANDGETISLNKGDYLGRYRSANETYFVMTSHDLKLEYKKS